MKWIGFLSVISLVSALCVVVVRHQNRLEFLQVRSAEEQRDQLNDEWADCNWRGQPGRAITWLSKRLDRSWGW